jgi:hypothetical protein
MRSDSPDPRRVARRFRASPKPYGVAPLRNRYDFGDKPKPAGEWHTDCSGLPGDDGNEGEEEAEDEGEDEDAEDEGLR